MNIGPLLMFDKSFLQMLRTEEFEQLSSYFMLVGAPTLLHEIIADLRKPAGRRLPEDMVRALAARMARANAMQPPNFRSLAISNLCGVTVSMIGQVPIDVSAPNVKTSKDGESILIDSTPEQRMWMRLARGEFASDDYVGAQAWRGSIERIDLHAVGRGWRQYVKDRFGVVRSIDEVVRAVDAMIANHDRETQMHLLSIILTFLRAEDDVVAVCFIRFLESAAGTLLRDLAPYAASVLRLYLVFVASLASQLIGAARPSNYSDLQYLFYAPFCMVFASRDRLHRALWPAASGENRFVWGDDLQRDLAVRLDQKHAMSEEDHKAKIEKYWYYPIDIEGSIVSEMWARFMAPLDEIIKSRRPASATDIDPKIIRELRAMIAQFDEPAK